MTGETTIFALSSGRGPAAIAVIRISGPAVPGLLDVMAPPRPRPRTASLRRIRHPSTGAVIDEALVLYFPAPRSETGEDLAELQLHGGRAVVEAALEALSSLPGCRLAAAGEFARRAFDNGKIDLTAAEGLADLIEAETEAQRRQAMHQAEGGLMRLAESWRQRLIGAQGLVEAGIDFSDEADVAAGAYRTAGCEVARISAEIREVLENGHRGEIVREGFQVVLTGPPNAGKSSLLNALARREAAIVSAEPGTTRDIVEVRLDLGGYPIVVVDTAGLRQPTGAVEQEGIRRSRARAREADLVIWVVDGAAPLPPDPAERHGPPPRLVVVNKSDLRPDLTRCGAADLLVSATSGAGLEQLVGLISAAARRALHGAQPSAEAPSEPAVLTRARHRSELDRCREALDRFLAAPADAPELGAEHLRQAGHALGRLTGAVTVDEVLDQVFSRFCIGK
jgi:tRNA modification GTPase